MFRSMFDHPQGDIFFLLFTSVTKGKIICLLYLLCFVLMLLHALRSLVVAVLHATTNQIILSLVTEVKKKYLPEDGQRLTETCRRILIQYDHFNVLF